MRWQSRMALATASLATVWVVCESLPFEAPFGMRVNGSGSVPFRLFVAMKRDKVSQRGSYVGIRHEKSPVLLAKQIVGLPGDQVYMQQGRVIVNGQDRGLVLSHSKSGEPLSPLGTCRIPEEHFFAWGSHAESFDSRYQEFGLIKLSDIEEVLWPVF